MRRTPGKQKISQTRFLRGGACLAPGMSIVPKKSEKDGSSKNGTSVSQPVRLSPARLGKPHKAAPQDGFPGVRLWLLSFLLLEM